MFRRTDFLWALPISALLALSGTNPAGSDFSQSILEPVSLSSSIGFSAIALSLWEGL